MIDMEHYGWLADEKDVEEYKDNIRKTKSSELQLDDFETIKNEFEITKEINVTDRPQAFVEILARAFLCGINGAAITHISGELTKEYSHERCFCELTQGEDIIGIAAVVGFKRFLIDAETKTAIGTRLRCFHLDVVIDIFL